MNNAPARECRYCRHWLFDVDVNERMSLGECRRYPTFVPRYSDAWCGEWSAKDEYLVTGGWRSRWTGPK